MWNFSLCLRSMERYGSIPLYSGQVRGWAVDLRKAILVVLTWAFYKVQSEAVPEGSALSSMLSYSLTCTGQHCLERQS